MGDDEAVPRVTVPFTDTVGRCDDALGWWRDDDGTTRDVNVLIRWVWVGPKIDGRRLRAGATRLFRIMAVVKIASQLRLSGQRTSIDRC